MASVHSRKEQKPSNKKLNYQNLLMIKMTLCHIVASRQQLKRIFFLHLQKYHKEQAEQQTAKQSSLKKQPRINLKRTFQFSVLLLQS